MVGRHLYVTGGVGAEPYGEKFSAPYDLPPDRAYAETCAAIGVILCARRLLETDLDGRHADVMEQALYNNVLAGLSLDGKRYLYVNPLEVVPALAKRRYECHLVKTQRVPWFGCACCPPNIARLLTSIGEYVCTRTEDGLAVHLYGGWEAAFAIRGVQARVALSTEYPWEGKVRISVSAAQPIEAALRLRIPGWCRGATLAINDEPAGPVSVENGYVAVRRRWGGEDRLVLDLPMPVERVRADPRVASAAGRVALQRGPVVYALEQTDHGPGLAALRLPSDAPLRSLAAPDLLGGCVVVETTGRRMETGGPLYGVAAPESREVTLRAVPYALWANRGEGEMTVWIHET
jgi:DUF1680 family protein